ncbi:MAG: NUDIX domain-containing protein [Proteobacteria bacterium]|nr:NUDIX domain-containing protein [Pseudomonadota bacterium]
MSAIERFCAFCGRPFDAPESGWPKDCACGEITFRNPIPVVNVMMPLREDGRTGLLVIQRGIEPCLGGWAFPGGYMELGETWQEAAARELFEETSLVVLPESLSVFHVDVNARRNRILIMVLAPLRQGMPFVPTNPEVSGARCIFEPEPLCFPPHTEAAEMFFARGS